MYSITTWRISSGEELKRRNGLGGSALDLRLIQEAISPPGGAYHVSLTKPLGAISYAHLPNAVLVIISVRISTSLGAVRNAIDCTLIAGSTHRVADCADDPSNSALRAARCLLADWLGSGNSRREGSRKNTC